MITSIGEEKILDKIQHWFLILKKLSEKYEKMETYSAR